MKRFLISVVFISLLCHSVSAQQAVNLDTALKNSVEYLTGRLPAGTRAIILNVTSDHTNLSNYIINEMTMALFNDGRLIMVDRQNLETIRQELKFQYSGDVSDESMVSIGKMLGLQSIISGNISPFGSVYRLQIRAIAVETGAIQGMQSLNIVFDETLAVLTGAKPPKPTLAERFPLNGKNVFAFSLSGAYLPAASFSAGVNITVFEKHYSKFAPSVFIGTNFLFLESSSDRISDFHYETHGSPAGSPLTIDDMKIPYTYMSVGGGVLLKYRVTDRFILNVGPSFEYFFGMNMTSGEFLEISANKDFFGLGVQGGLSYRVHPNISLDLNGIVKFGFGSAEYTAEGKGRYFNNTNNNLYKYTYTVKQPIVGGVLIGVTFMFPYGGKR